MSRGPGRVECAITAAFEAQPDSAFDAYDLMAAAFPEETVSYSQAQYVSSMRAAKNVAERMG